MEANVEKQLCPHCQTGYDTYMLDNRSTVCPYLDGYNENGCIYYKKLKTNDDISGE